MSKILDSAVIAKEVKARLGKSHDLVTWCQANINKNNFRDIQLALLKSRAFHEAEIPAKIKLWLARANK